MTPKEKAEWLVDKMTIDFDMCRGQNIKCALIAVDEILNYSGLEFIANDMYNYYSTVKADLKKL